MSIKVNTYGGSSDGSVVFTHSALVTAVAQALQEIGNPSSKIFVYDLNPAGLAGATPFPVNPLEIPSIMS